MFCRSQEAKTLCYWTRKGNYEEVARLLQSTNVDWKDEEGRTALHWACDGYRNKRNKTRNNTKSSVKVVVNTQKEFLQRGHLKIAELLISKGANINAQVSIFSQNRKKTNKQTNREKNVVV